MALGGNISTSLVSYVDADWAGDLTDRKSTTGHMTYYKGCLIAWGSKKVRSTVSLSSTEAEIHGMMEGAKVILQLQPIVTELGYPEIEKSSILIGDNLPSMNIIMGTKSTKRAKHFDVQCDGFGSE